MLRWSRFGSWFEDAEGVAESRSAAWRCYTSNLLGSDRDIEVQHFFSDTELTVELDCWFIT